MRAELSNYKQSREPYEFDLQEYGICSSFLLSSTPDKKISFISMIQSRKYLINRAFTQVTEGIRVALNIKSVLDKKANKAYC